MSEIHSDPADIDLINSLCQGNRHALTTLYDRYGSLVYTLAFKLLESRDEAEDLTQDIFLNLWKQDKFDSQRGKLSTYLCLLTRSRAIGGEGIIYTRQLATNNRFCPKSTTITCR